MQAKVDKAPGRDEITFRVWQELWPVVKDEVVRLYQASLELKHVPERWRTTKIVLLRKPNKPDYSRPKVYRPTSLLETISKGLEVVVARRLSYLAETYILRPEDQFGGRPRRSGDQALGIHSFCSNSKASVVVGEYESPMQEIEHARISQGPPLSPLLYLFYKANLVQSRSEKGGGSIGFVHDYNAWVTGSDAEANRQELQMQLILRVEQWAQESGAVFGAEKTSSIHFVPRTQAEPIAVGGLMFEGQSIQASATVRVLGVTFDSKPTMDDHISRVAFRAIGQCMALRNIPGI